MMKEYYVPLFSRLMDSSVWEEPLHVRVMWITLMGCQDPDHVVRIKAHHLRRKANLTDEEVMNALKVLSEPDRRTKIPQEHEGRRIEKVEDGWLLLNGEYYLKLMQDINRKARLARAQAGFRERKKSKPLPGESGFVRALEAGAPERDLDRIVETSGLTGGLLGDDDSAPDFTDGGS